MFHNWQYITGVRTKIFSSNEGGKWEERRTEDEERREKRKMGVRREREDVSAGEGNINKDIIFPPVMN